MLATTITGYIEVNDSSHFVSNVLNDDGEFDITTDPADALQVSFDPAGSPFSITGLNVAYLSDYPYFGGITGFASATNDLASGSSDYAYLGGTSATNPAAAPSIGANSFTDSTAFVETIESAIWSISSANVLSAQWINTDSTSPPTYIEDSSGILVLTGDPDQFAGAFGAASVDTLIVVAAAQTTGEAAPEPGSVIFAGIGLSAIACVLRSRRIPA